MKEPYLEQDRRGEEKEWPEREIPIVEMGEEEEKEKRKEESLP